MYKHLVTYCRTFYNTSVRCKISFQYSKSACLSIWVVDWTDNFRILILTSGNILSYCLSCYSHAVCVKKSLLIQLIHNCINSACFVQIFNISMTCRCKMTKVWSLLADRICKINLEIHTNLMCDCRKVKHAVCRASKCHINCKCIKDCIFCHNISRADILSYKLHHLHTCMLCKLDSCRINSWDCSISFQPHTKSLCQTVHTVCRIHTGTGSASRTCFILKFANVFVIHLSGCIRTYCFKHTGKTCFTSLYMSCKHRSAAYKYCRYIHTGSCHQKSRYILVTVWNHYKSVKLMCHSKSFCRICDQISCYERIFHTDMSHSNTITDSNCRNHDWCSSGHCHAKFNCFCDLIQIHVPRYNLIIRTYNTDQWTI